MDKTPITKPIKIDKIEHPDGRVDVVVHVPTLELSSQNQNKG